MVTPALPIEGVVDAVANAAYAALEALGDPNRRAIVEIISRGPCPVRAIAEHVPISRPAVSRHLRLLKEAGLVEAVPHGRQRIYRLRAEGVDAVRAYFHEMWDEAAARYKLAVENIDAGRS
jgi:DNA-binding transcriptional ArsR family regulator